MTDQQTTGVDVVLKPRPGFVACETTPSGARVVFNGRDRHEAALIDSQTQTEMLTPLRSPLPLGAYTLRFELKGYRSVTRTIAVTPNHTAEVSLVLDKVTGPEEGQA